MAFVLFVIGFGLLIKGAGWLVDGATVLAEKQGLSEMIIGLTIVSFGTSLPELTINILSSLDNKSDIAIGNVFGSNISNILLILGCAAMICRISVPKASLFIEIPFSILATLLVGYLANVSFLQSESNDELMLSGFDGALLLFFFIVFMGYIYYTSNEEDIAVKVENHISMSIEKAILFIVIGVIGLSVGGKWTVDGAIIIAKYFELSDVFIGLTIMAIGTSLPELVTTIVAATKRKTDIIIGNIIGSNIFNLLWILGISAIIKPLTYNSSSNIDVMMILFSSTLVILLAIFTRKRFLGRFAGIIFILVYIGYLVYLIQHAKV